VAGPLNRGSLAVALVCDEEAVPTEGEDAHKETRCVHHEELLHRRDPGTDGPPCTARRRLRIPAGAMHSFEAGDNKVRWKVRVEGQTRRPLRLRFRYEFPLAVYPPREEGGR
jgi:hypothetical protein